jgi:hypothetical protein
MPGHGPRVTNGGQTSSARGYDYAVAMDAVRFPIRIGRRSRWVVRLFGATPSTAYAEVGDDLLIRFGWFTFRTPLANIERYRIEGPFTWIKAIGVRMSLRHPDLSFCGSAHGGVRMDLKHRVRWGLLRMFAVWAGTDDLDGFAAELARRGIPGQDARQGR